MSDSVDCQEKTFEKDKARFVTEEIAPGFIRLLEEKLKYKMALQQITDIPCRDGAKMHWIAREALRARYD